MESVREWPEVQNQSQGNLVWVVTEAKEREHFRERVATIAERQSRNKKKRKKKSLLINLPNNQKIQIKTIRFHCSTTRWLRFSRLILVISVLHVVWAKMGEGLVSRW